jgi:hypothetical protein
MVTRLRLDSLALLGVMVLTTPLARGADAPTKPVTKTIPVTGHNDLMLTVPEGWDLSYQRSASGPPTIFARKLGSKETGITINVTPVGKGTPVNAEKARAALEARAKVLLPQLKETALEYKELNGSSAAGFYCLITYRKPPEKGRGVHGTLATVAVGDLLLSCDVAQNFTIGPYQKAALEMLRNAFQQPTAAATTGPTSKPAK